jgi:hypothetical protein
LSRFLGFLFLVAALLVSLSGCGGSGDSGTVDVSQFAGSYSASYTRSPGNMIIAVASNAQITITIVDGVEGTFVGTGIANHVGGFYITCHGIGDKQVTIYGTLKGTGLGRTASGTIAGTISVNYNAKFVSDPDTTIYTNHYEGTYSQGSTKDVWLGDVGTDGSFSGQLILSATQSQVNLTGTVYSNGSFKFAGKAGTTTYAATGNFALNPSGGVLCNGLLKGTKGTTTVTGNFSGESALGG